MLAPDTIALIELQFVKLGIQSLGAQKFLMSPTFYNFAFLNDEDAVGPADRG